MSYRVSGDWWIFLLCFPLITPSVSAIAFLKTLQTLALGHPVEDLTLSQSTIRRTRMATRKEVSEADKDSFSTQCPLLLHWDGKLLACIDGTKETVDRIVVIVTGNGVEKLLAVPKIGKGTGEEQAAACLKVLGKSETRFRVWYLTRLLLTQVYTGVLVFAFRKHLITNLWTLLAVITSWR